MNPQIITDKPWVREAASKLELDWKILDDPRDATAPLLFFVHWSERVSKRILDAHECVNFHMTDLPYGRGGTPLQHLILEGRTRTTLTAHRMTEQLDAGPVYTKQWVSLRGSAEEIYKRASLAALLMAIFIAKVRPEPREQQGEPVVFRRRTPKESAIPGNLGSVGRLYDFIRMLDAPGYPRAFLEHGGFRYEFSKARHNGEGLIVEAHIQ